MVARVLSVAPIGFDGAFIEVECDMKKGLPSMQIVGMGNKAIDEAKDRVRSAISNSMLDFPAKKIVINLAPAELPKDGAHFDLPIALSILTISQQLSQDQLKDSVFAGELALDGSLRPIRGAINIAEAARKHNIKRIFIPRANAEQASLIEGLEVIGVTSLKELFLHLKSEIKLEATQKQNNYNNPSTLQSTTLLDDIRGQAQAKRAMTVAIAGRHNILLNGPPGAGKTMLAKTAVSLLPALTVEEKIAATKLHSLAGEVDGDILDRRPFRTPHHTASRIAIVGGGNKPKPGEISLAHHGVLFLDELPEYSRSLLESLRQPLEDKQVSISRVGGRVTYPADFILIATQNPCPCGYYGDQTRECTCSPVNIQNYQKRLSGPLLDRIDLHISVARVETNSLLEKPESVSQEHEHALTLIKTATELQAKRYNKLRYNGNLSSNEVRKHIVIEPEAKSLLEHAASKLDLSARSYFKVIKVARTIADIEQSDLVQASHIAEALQYRG